MSRNSTECDELTTKDDRLQQINVQEKTPKEVLEPNQQLTHCMAVVYGNT